ncbi:thymidine phosphorylase [Myxococcota bacterium]|nr:thymidine phosphorylase [Myxococcota bacterium]
MLMTEVIRRKRDGGRLDEATIRTLIREIATGGVPDYQVAALLMAIYFQGLDGEELAAWTDAMLRSGDVFDLSDIPGPKVDKHSTGGVGDKISIPLAPLVAACGVRVPMISGRGLGHTGGTLDKLESMPGFRTDLPPERFVQGVREVGVCMIGQTDRIVPADRRLYALRDVTGTVESIPLIAASILSKKLAEGISGLVLDVKVGTGAFMKTEDRARLLAETLADLGERSGVRTVACLTDMDDPIGWAVGNALEIEETLEVLQGKGPADTVELVEVLGGQMLALGGVVPEPEEGARRIRAARHDGSGLEVFRHMVAFQGGDPRLVEDPGRLPRARFAKEFRAEAEGVVESVDCEAVGLAALVLGGGRRRKEDPVDPAVGLRVLVHRGDRVRPGDPLAILCYNDPDRVPEAERLLRGAWRAGPGPVVRRPRLMGLAGKASSPPADARGPSSKKTA